MDEQEESKPVYRVTQTVRLRGLPALRAKINMKQKVIVPRIRANVRKDKA